MLRRSRFIPALAVAACGLLAASCSAAAPAQSSQAQSGQAPAARTLTAGPAPVYYYTAVAFPRPASGWLLGQSASGAARAEIWHSVTAGRTW